MGAPTRFPPLYRVYDSEGDDEQCRLQFSLNTFAERERDTVPDVLFYYWDSLRGAGGRMPRLHDFRPKAIFGARTNWLIRGVDVQAEDPASFILRDHSGGPRNPLAEGLDGRPVSAFPSRIHVRATLAEYQLCKQLGRPLYHEIHQVVCGTPRAYTRILLPLAGDDGKVARLAYGVRPKPLFGTWDSFSRR